MFRGCALPMNLFGLEEVMATRNTNIAQRIRCLCVGWTVCPGLLRSQNGWSDTKNRSGHHFFVLHGWHEFGVVYWIKWAAGPSAT